MINRIIWNIRGVKSKGVFYRLIKLVRIHKVSFVTLQEPFVDSSNIQHFKRELGFPNIALNYSGNIWRFWDSNFNCIVVDDHVQQITLQVQYMMT